jgi:hypothetical protein
LEIIVYISHPRREFVATGLRTPTLKQDLSVYIGGGVQLIGISDHCDRSFRLILIAVAGKALYCSDFINAAR